MVAVTTERGYEATNIGEIASRAKVDPATFKRHFESLEDCFLTAWNAIDAALLERMESAFDSRLDWPDRLRAALSAGMEFLAADERRARFYVSEVLRVDDRMRDRQVLARERLSLAIDVGREDRAPKAVADAISGAIWHRVHQLLRSGRASDLPAEVPRFMYLAVLPYRGSAAAAAELDRR
jgi:AcrR family transcriptional regulator